MKIITVILLTIILNSCATIFTGTSEEFKFESSEIKTKVFINGEDHGYTPLSVKLTKCEDHDIIFTKPGFQDEYIKYERQYDSALAFGSVVMFGPIGGLIDDSNCAYFKFDNKSVYIDLEQN